MFASTSCLDGSVQSQKIGLLSKVIDDFDDLADVVSAVPQNVNDFRGRLNRVIGAIETVGGLFHGRDAIHHFFARTIGDVEQNLGSVSHAVDRSNHLIDGSGSLSHAGSLHLRVFHHVLHVDAHLVHGAGDFFNCGRRLHADFGGFVCGTGNLTGSRGNLAGGIARGANKVLQSVGHAKESIAQRVALGARDNFHAQVAFGNGHGDAGHFFQVRHHVVKGGGQRTNFVVAVNINVLIEITGV